MKPPVQGSVPTWTKWTENIYWSPDLSNNKMRENFKNGHSLWNRFCFGTACPLKATIIFHPHSLPEAYKNVPPSPDLTFIFIDSRREYCFASFSVLIYFCIGILNAVWAPCLKSLRLKQFISFWNKQDIGVFYYPLQSSKNLLMANVI